MMYLCCADCAWTLSYGTVLFLSKMQYAAEMFILGEARTGLYNLLVRHVCHVWMDCFERSPEVATSSLIAHTELILQACLFGPVYKKNLRSVTCVFSVIDEVVLQ